MKSIKQDNAHPFVCDKCKQIDSFVSTNSPNKQVPVPSQEESTWRGIIEHTKTKDLSPVVSVLKDLAESRCCFLFLRHSSSGICATDMSEIFTQFILRTFARPSQISQLPPTTVRHQFPQREHLTRQDILMVLLPTIPICRVSRQILPITVLIFFSRVFLLIFHSSTDPHLTPQREKKDLFK